MKLCRKKTSDPDVIIYTDINDLPPQWDEHLTKTHFLHSTNLCIAANAQLPQVSFFYVLLLLAGKKISQGQFMELRFAPEHLNPKLTQAWKVKAWRVLQTLVKPKMLISGHLFRHDVESCAIFISDPYEQFISYKTMLESVVVRSKPRAVLLKDVPEHLMRYFHHFDTRYQLLRNDVAMTLNLDTHWVTFKDYEHALKHKYAQRARKVRRSFEGVEKKELSTEEVFESASAIYSLYRQVTEKQKATLGFISETYIPLLKKSDPDHFKVWGFYNEGEMVAFASAWQSKTAVDMFYIGLNYAHNQRLQLYFNILFFVLEQAILAGVPNLILGRTALEAKARLGCKPHYLTTMIRVTNPFLRWVYTNMQQSADLSEGEWEQRHPFKEVSERVPH